MAAETFETVMLRITCARMAQDTLAYSSKQDTPVHPSWRTVERVLEGMNVVRIAKNGYIDVARKP
jgi:hypothetical protein